MQVLVGDIGGTKTLLALAQVENNTVKLGARTRYTSADHDDFTVLAKSFLQEEGARPAAACLAIAGPVEQTPTGQRAKLTNLPWLMDTDLLGSELAIPDIQLVNDFMAMGHCIPALGTEDLVTLQAGEPVADAPSVVLGAGTGLGQALIMPYPDTDRVFPTEGGHADFAPQGKEQIGLYGFLAERFDHVSWERILSGAGLTMIYEYLMDSTGLLPPPQLQNAFGENHDPAPVISMLALARRDTLSETALDLFVRVYAAQAGNLALTTLARRGVYLSGGIAAKILPRLQDGIFIETFNSKGRMQPVTRKMPVYVIVHPEAGLIGAAQLAARNSG